METAVAILMVLGIYVAIPVAIGFAILGAVTLSRQKVQVGKAEAVSEVEGQLATVGRELVGAGRKSG